jgi:hypothetical protein
MLCAFNLPALRCDVCSLKEHYNTAYDCVFLSAAATGAKEGLLLAAYHSGDIR